VPFKATILILLSLVAAGSVAARVWLSPDEALEREDASASGARTSPFGVSSMAPEQPGESPDTAFDPDRDSRSDGSGDSDGAAEVMPYVTEGSFFALIGFALGYLSRKILKLALLLLALLFLAVQGLSYAEVVSIDWDRALQVFNDLVLNVKENQTLGEILKNRLPSAGGLTAGYLLGFRKG